MSVIELDRWQFEKRLHHCVEYQFWEKLQRLRDSTGRPAQDRRRSSAHSELTPNTRKYILIAVKSAKFATLFSCYPFKMKYYMLQTKNPGTKSNALPELFRNNYLRFHVII